MKNKLNTLALVLVATIVPGQAGAEETYELKPNLVVTPSRRAESLSESLAAISLLTREDIEKSAAEDLSDLLRTLPGVDVVRSGGPGSQVSIFLRGSNSNHVLVLVDGVRTSSSNTGAYAWEQLPVNQIERIEVVRGPRGSMYGSDAIGGVIHIITRSSPAPYARITTGSYGTAGFEGGLGYEGENTQISVNAGYRNVDGFSAQNPDGFSYHPDDDGFESANLGIKGATTMGEGRWTYSLLALESESEFDQGVSETRQTIAALGLHGSMTANWDYQLLAGYTREELESDFGFYATGFDSNRFQFAWQNQFDTGTTGVLSFGLDWISENGESLYSWDEKRRNTGLYGTWDHYFGRLHAQLGGRWDDNSVFGSQFTGQAAFGFEINESWQFMASYGSAFRGPNLNEQYSPGWAGLFAGNPDLDPESSASAELGLRWQHSQAGALSVSAYRTEVEDLIAFNGEGFQAINIKEARLKGLEFDYQYQGTNWDFSANATLQDAKDSDTGEPLLRRPDEKAFLSLDRRFENGSWLGLEWVYSGGRYDFAGIALDSYQLVNLFAGWHFTPAWRVELRGENLAGEVYEPVYGFNAPGRSWFISLAWIP
ncbi:MAG: TonB-dependent receptor [Xanthomonadales bacterium]|jgi:vitamin B12 transporter|nr:TonB-dependent receptor [Xanthomonadales bacterium]